MTELRQTRLSLQQIQRIWLLWKSIWWVQYCKVHALNRKFPMDLLLTDQTITQPAANIWMMHELRQQINSHDKVPCQKHFYYYLKSHLNTGFKIINKLILNFRKKSIKYHLFFVALHYIVFLFLTFNKVFCVQDSYPGSQHTLQGQYMCIKIMELRLLLLLSCFSHVRLCETP